jgi:hypothetical protein
MNLLPGDGKLFRQISTPSGAFLWLGLAILATVLIPGTFNPLRLRIGSALVLLSFAFADLQLVRVSYITITMRAATLPVRWGKLIMGVFWLAWACLSAFWPWLPLEWRARLSLLLEN